MPHLLAVSADFMLDVALSTPEITVGAVMRATTVSGQGVGNAVELARTLRQLGRTVEVAGFLGGSSGKFVHQQLEVEGLQGHFVWCDGETPRRLIFTEANGRTTIINEQGINVDSAQLKQFAAKLSALRSHFGWMSFSGSDESGISPASYAAIIDAVRPTKIAANCHGEVLTVLARRNIDLLCINGQEAGRLLGWSIETVNDAHRACMTLQKWGNSIVFIGIGELGAVGYDGNESWHAVVPVLIAERVAEADKYLFAGVLNALMSGESMSEVLRQGVVMATVFSTSNPSNDWRSRSVLRRLDHAL